MSAVKLAGLDDSCIYNYAKDNSLTILTIDKDFLDIFSYPLDHTAGRVIIRLKNLKISEFKNKVTFNLNALIKDRVDLNGKLAIISNSKIRIISKKD